MVMTWLGNRRRVEEATIRGAREAKKILSEAEERGSGQVESGDSQAWQEWYKSVKPDLEAGRPPSVPPPTGNVGVGDSENEQLAKDLVCSYKGLSEDYPYASLSEVERMGVCRAMLFDLMQDMKLTFRYVFGRKR